MERQSIGNVDNGTGSVATYGALRDLSFPLLFNVFKPQRRLKPDDKYPISAYLKFNQVLTSRSAAASKLGLFSSSLNFSYQIQINGLTAA